MIDLDTASGWAAAAVAVLMPVCVVIYAAAAAVEIVLLVRDRDGSRAGKAADQPPALAREECPKHHDVEPG